MTGEEREEVEGRTLEVLLGPTGTEEKEEGEEGKEKEEVPSGWFSMSPLPRLHHHDYCGVIQLEVNKPCHDKVLLSHFNQEKKKKAIPWP